MRKLFSLLLTGTAVCGMLIATTSTAHAFTLVFPKADVSIVKIGPASLAQTASLAYTLVVSNAGPNAALNVVVTDAIPAGLILQSAPGCMISGTVVTCAAGTLTPGQTRTFVLTFAVAPSACNRTVKNTAKVASETSDPNLANNTSNTVSTTVTCRVQNQLTITVLPGIASDTAVRNQKNIRLLGFKVHDESDGTLFTNAVFDAQAGTLSNAQNYSLWVDADANGMVETVLQSGVSSIGGKVTFDRMVGGGYVVAPTKTVLFEVHTDIASSLADPRSLQLKFATSSPDYVKAEDYATGMNFVGIKTDGSCATTCEIAVATVPSTRWMLVDQGNVYVTRSTSPVSSHQLLGGQLGDAVMRIDMRAEYEDVGVTNLVLTGIGVNAPSTASNVDSLELYKVGESVPFATATVAGCGTTPVPANSFCATMQNQQLVAPKGTTASVLVRPRLKTDSAGARSGQEVMFMVDANSGTSNGSVRASGMVSAGTLNQNDNDALAEGEVFIGTSVAGPAAQIVGSKNVVLLSKVLSIMNADPNADGTAVPTGAGRAFGQFKFAAAANANTQNGLNKFTIDGVIFNVNATNVAMAAQDFKLYNKADPTVKASCTPKDLNGVVLAGTVTGAFTLDCSNLIASTVLTAIDQGTESTFVLEGTITNAKILGIASVLQASLQNFNESAASFFGTAASHMKWLDQDSGSSVNFLWIEYPNSVVSSTQYQG